MKPEEYPWFIWPYARLRRLRSSEDLEARKLLKFYFVSAPVGTSCIPLHA